MIKNERQYRITKAQAQKFAEAIEQIQSGAPGDGLSGAERQLHVSAMQSQLEDLRSQISSYDRLRSGFQSVIEAGSLADLPRLLIQARIAAGLSQKDLAEMLGLKEQQVQLYEQSDYSGASLSRLLQVSEALKLTINQEVILPNSTVTKRNLLRHMASLGFERNLVINHMLPATLAARLEQEPDSPKDGYASTTVAEAGGLLSRMIGVRTADLFAPQIKGLPLYAVSSVRFKAPQNANELKLSAFSVYAHYLALLALNATEHLSVREIPSDWSTVRNAIGSPGVVTFESVLDYVWGLGIPVLPLAISGNFHGACWRVGGRNVIVLKQQARYSARWLMDLLHELRHAGESPDLSEFSVIETGDVLQGANRISEEEEQANFFAEDVIFNGEASEIAEECVSRAGGNMEYLKRVVPSVATQRNVPTGALAYYIAFVLSDQGQNWWGAATNLQERELDPWKLARDKFVGHATLNTVNERDRALLTRALSDGDED